MNKRSGTAIKEEQDMNRLKNIVVGVDFSERARHSVVAAARLAKWNSSKLHLVHVVEAAAAAQLAEHDGRDVEDLRMELVADAKASLQEWAAAVDLPEKASFRVAYGHPTDELIKQIKQVNAELFVGGVRGTVDEARGAGTQATRLVRQAPCKVLLVESGEARPFRTVVAAIDFSPTSKIVIEQALQIAALDASRVHFVHVYAAPWRKLHYRSEAKYSGEFQNRYLSKLEDQLRDFVGSPENVEISFSLKQAQTHGCGIGDFARECGADLVVIGTRGLNSLKYLLLGSTAEYVLREQPCSILAVRPPE